MLKPATLLFLKELAKNNTKEWFDAHRTQYGVAKEDYAALIDDVIKKHSKKDASIAAESAKQAMFRINRDIRFSKDKSPYKTNFGASICKGGRKSKYAGYYIHIEPGNKSFVGGGLWMPEPDVLKSVRQEIDYRWKDFRKIISGKKFVSVFGDLDKSAEITLSREPKGYTKDNPAIEYIKLKHLIVAQSLDDKEISDAGLEKKILSAFEAMQPLLQFLNEAIGIDAGG
ncbi:MAG: DUF2461 domain-containing protein [Chitinophagaceae bacterium]|jgi:uncharacterized protein (TIGR02453 family)|nr:DUF2461 domain-containing protein [Chitinophagaceae bacterium]